MLSEPNNKIFFYLFVYLFTYWTKPVIWHHDKNDLCKGNILIRNISKAYIFTGPSTNYIAFYFLVAFFMCQKGIYIVFTNITYLTNCKIVLCLKK